MDTKLGILNLSKEQKANLPHIVLPKPFKGFTTFEDGTVFGVSEDEPTKEEIESAKITLKNISIQPDTAIEANKARIKKVKDALKTLGLNDEDLKQVLKLG